MTCDIEMAAFNLAHDYGIKKLAAELDVSPNVLNKQVDPNIDTHRLSLATASKIQRIAKNPSILKAMADDMGYMIAKKPEVSLNGDGLFDNALDLSKRFGNVSATLEKINADRKITASEAKLFRIAVLELMSSALEFDLEVHDIAVDGD